MRTKKILALTILFCAALASAPFAVQAEEIQDYTNPTQETQYEMPDEEIQAAYFRRMYGQVKETVTPRQVDKAALKLSSDWQAAKSAPAPVMGAAGAVTYEYGTVTPRIYCRPLRVTDIMLQPGEKVINAPAIGDSTLWSITPSASGSGDSLTVHILVKPTMPKLATNLIVHTDRRTYIFDLISQSKDYTPFVSFRYPDWEKQQEWKAFLAKQEEERARYAPVVLPSQLNHNYTLTGKQVPWFPIDVCDDGVKTFITFPERTKSSEMPVFYTLRGKRKEIVNYRTVGGNQFVIDKIFKAGVLVAGVGAAADQVFIRRGPSPYPKVTAQPETPLSAASSGVGTIDPDNPNYTQN